MSMFRGETTQAPILGAKFFTHGACLTGVVAGTFRTALGICTTVKLLKPIQIRGNQINPPRREEVSAELVSIGGLRGFESAIIASGAGALQIGDRIVIECTGEQDTGKQSAMVTFRIEVDRDDKPGQ